MTEGIASVTFGYEVTSDDLALIYPVDVLRDAIASLMDDDTDAAALQELVEVFLEGIDDLRFIFTRDDA